MSVMTIEAPVDRSPTTSAAPIETAGRGGSRLAVPLTVVAFWAAAVSLFGLWPRVGDGLSAAATMVFGSLVAGSTPQGGGAVAFPVFTKLLEVPPAAARTFSLSIQAVGMGTATLLIVMRRLPVAWRAVRVLAAAACSSFLLGVVLLTDAGPFRPSVVPDDLTKVGFTVIVAALAVLTARLRKADLWRLDVDLDAAPVRVLVLTGVGGGLLSVLVGSGADVAAFLALTLVFRVRPGVAVPSSVVVMAIVSVLGLFTLGLADGQLLATTPTVDLPAAWLAAAPVVAVGAPLGSWLASKASDRLLLTVVVTLAAAEVISTIVFLDRLRMDAALAIGALSAVGLIVRSLWAVHQRRAAEHHRASSPETPLPLAPITDVPSESSESSESSKQGERSMPVDRELVLAGGVASRAGHLNHPAARYCRRTGQRLDREAGSPAVGARPALGVLCLDDGSSYLLTDDLVIGRAPRRHHLVADRAARPLRLRDHSGSLSRAHLLITLRGWDVRVADLGSSNGTWHGLGEDETRVRLTPGEAITVPSGSVLECGGRRLRIDLLHVR